MTSDNERRDSWNKRQIDDIEKKVDSVLSILNGNGRIGLAGKVDIMWGYRLVFLSVFSVNIIALITFVIYLFKGGA